MNDYTDSTKRRLALAAALAASALPFPPALGADAGTVVVEGQRGGYRTLTVAGATKTDALPKDLPQSVRTLTADLLQDAGVTSLAGALDLASGIARQSDLGGLWDSYAMRGFTGDPNFGSDYMVNGFAASRGYNGLRDIAGTQAVEILKGSASALYGRGEPGGTVNILTKKPRFAPRITLEAWLASHGTRRVAADFTGPLSAAVAYRLNAAHQGGDNFRGLHTDRDYVAPSLLWLAGPETTISYELEASRQRSPFDRGIPVLDGRPEVPVEHFLGEPADGPIAVKSLGHQLFIQHGLGNGWSLQGGAAYRDSSLSGYSSEANDVQPDGRTLRRQRRFRDWSATDRSVRAEVLGTVATFGVKHTLLFGADAYRFDDSRIQLRRNPGTANPYAIDLYAPAHGATTAAPLALAIDTLEHQRAHAVYAQDQLALGDEWKMLVGVRHDRYRQTVINHRTAAVNAQEVSATSPRAGIVWQPAGMLSLYASVARGFRPNSGIGIDNSAFPAERSLSYELGAKAETRRGLAGTLALYRIDKENVLTTNPVNTDFAVAAGEVASKGVELDVSGELARGVRLSGAYAYTDARVTRGDNTITTGSRLPNVARHSGNVLLVASNARASIGGGVAYVGERRGDVAASSAFVLPGYTTARLLATWLPSKGVRLALNVDNLFDRRYYASSYSRLWVAPGSTRTASLTATCVF